MSKVQGTSAMQPAPDPKGRQQWDSIDWARRYAETHVKYTPPEAGSEQRLLTEAFFRDLWGDISPDTENIIFCKGKKRQSWLLSAVQNESKRNRFLKAFWDEDLFFTPNTRKPAGKFEGDARRCNIYRVVSWAIDVDYKKGSGQRFTDPLTYYENVLLPLMDGIMPIPNWIEHGHCLRLIYILDEPIAYKNGKSLIKGLEAVQKSMVTALNEQLDCYAEAQPISSYYRIPGSHNSRDGSLIQLQKGKADRWTVQELMDEFLPDLPYTKRQYDRLRRRKATTRRTQGKVTHIFNNFTLLSERLTAFEKLRAWPDIPREKLAFLYGTTWRTMYPDAEHDSWIQAICTFNTGFPVPLKEKEIKSKFRTLKIYKYKNSTICAELGLTEEVLSRYDALCLTTSKREREKAEAINAGATREQKTATLDTTIWTMYQEGCTNEAIANATGRSATTIRNRLTRIRKQHGDTSRRKKR